MGKLSNDSRSLLTAFFCSILILLSMGCGQPDRTEFTDHTNPNVRELIAGEIETELENLLDVWYPRVIDREHGGYLSRFTYDWQQDKSQDKMIVTQARHLWTLSKVGQKYPDDSSYLEYAAHGFDFLRQHMWDETHGGFYQSVTRDGEVIAGDGMTAVWIKTRKAEPP